MTCFFDLPRPIRETIYRHALVKARIFVRPLISMEYLTNPYREEIYGIPNLALLCTTCKIYREAMPIYLGENTFSIVQVDMLAAARMENRRVAKNLQQIRKLELIFDHRDYKYLAQFLGAELPTVATEIDDWADDSPFKRASMRELGRIQAHFGMCSSSSTTTSSSTSSPASPSFPVTARNGFGLRKSLFNAPKLDQQKQQQQHGTDKPHERHIENMKEYLWGRTLTFVRQTFQLTHLYIDLRQCTCSSGCCRLADQVLDWGWVYVWIHGLPDEVQVRGSSVSEKEVIARSLDRQSFRPKLKMEEIYDQRRVKDYRGFMQYNALLRKVYRRVTEL